MTIDSRQRKITGFFTDNEGRVRPITRRNKVARVREPRSVRQAALMVLDGELDYEPASPELVEEFNRLNNEYFKGLLPDASIIMVYLPKVRHKGFCIRDHGIIVINTARARTLKEQIEVLRHEVIHLSGVGGHGFLFNVIARSIDAPVGESPEGKPLYYDEYQDYIIKREVERKKRRVEELEKKYGVKKGEGTLMVNGKPAARVIGWMKTRGGGFPIVIPRSPITRIEQIPKKAKKVEIVLFDKLGYPKPKTSKWISRDELNKYHLIE